MPSRRETMRAYLDRIVAGDLEGAAAYYTDDVTLHQSGRGPLSGDHVGKDAVLALFRKLRTAVDAMTTEEHDLLVSDDHAVVLTKSTFRRGDRSLTGNRVVVFHVAGDRISEVWVVDERQQDVDEFMSA